MLSEGRVQVQEGVEPSLRDEERSLRQRLNAAAQAQEEALAAKRAAHAEAAGREIPELTAQLAEVEEKIRRASPRYAALTQPQPLSLAEIQQRVLDDDTLLLEYALGDARSLLWVVSREALTSVPLAPRADIERAARQVHARLADPPVRSRSGEGAEAWRADVDELSRLVLPPPARGLLTRKRLLVVAPGALQYVPFGVLRVTERTRTHEGAMPGSATREESEPLLERFEVLTAPSASIVATLRLEQAGRVPATRTVAVLADPVFDRNDPRVSARARQAEHGGSHPALERALRSIAGPDGRTIARLPFSNREAEAIVASAQQGKALKLTGFAATREAATSPGLLDYQILHFATHGVLNTRQPDLSGVVLSLVDREGRAQDGFLRLHDIYNLKLGAEVVVLSGCQTGLGKELRGEGLVGLARGFMYAGARSVVASLWRVDDESTSELMQRFYRAMLKEGRRPADALRIAQLELSRSPRWAAPFYWAGFVLQGDWK
jgi:CHAT domain-containing protein